MLGCYDFCGYYDWTFAWLAREGGDALLRRYWDRAIHRDSQAPRCATLVREKGLAGMAEYWGHTLAEEAPSGGYSARPAGDRFLIEMTACPSRGFLVRNGLDFSGDYCDHCIGWIGPLMKEAGYTINHDHDHLGRCWWEILPAAGAGPPVPEAGRMKKRFARLWAAREGTVVDRFRKASGPGEKIPPGSLRAEKERK